MTGGRAGTVFVPPVGVSGCYRRGAGLLLVEAGRVLSDLSQMPPSRSVGYGLGLAAVNVDGLRLGVPACCGETRRGVADASSVVSSWLLGSAADGARHRSPGAARMWAGGVLAREGTSLCAGVPGCGR